MDLSSSKALEDSLTGDLEQYHPHARRVLTHMLTKPMQQANYFCTGSLPQESWGHFALSMDRYTHFTSPIRRYPDLVVHRLLQQAINLADASTPQARLQAQLLATCQASALSAFEQFDQDPETEGAQQAVEDLTDLRQQELTQVCEHCNDKKQKARKAQEASSYVFLAVTLRAHPIEAEAVVLGLGDRFLTLIAVGFDIEAKCYLEESPLIDTRVFDEASKTLTLSWKPGAVRPSERDAAAPAEAQLQELRPLSIVRVLLYTKENQVPLAIAMRLLPC